MDSLNHRSKDEVMDAAEVAKKNKIGVMVDHTADQIERMMGNDRNGVEVEKDSVDETVDDEEVKSDNEVAKVKPMKKVTVRFVSKGRGVSGIKKDPVRVKGTNDSMDTDPFLTIESGADSARQSCVRKMNEPASHWHGSEPSASPMPMDGEW